MLNFILVTAENFKSHCPGNYYVWEIHQTFPSELVMLNYCFIDLLLSLPTLDMADYL